MDKEIIEKTKAAIKKQEDAELIINARLAGLKNKITDAERDLFKASNIKESLIAALVKLEEAEVRLRGGE